MANLSDLVSTAGVSDGDKGDITVSNSGATWTIDGGLRVNVVNLKPVVNAAANKLDVLTKSGGAVPDATNAISVNIPDANGFTARTRAAAYLSGTSQFVMADAANYWSKGSLDAEIKTAYVYAIWDGTGIVWALAGYSGFNIVPTTTTVTDDDYFLLEASSTYSRSASHYCVCVAKIRYQYDTADTPDHTIQATGENAPQVIWNPKSDYSKSVPLATTNTSAGNIADYSCVSTVVKQSGRYSIVFALLGASSSAEGRPCAKIRTGSSTYASATIVATGYTYCSATYANATVTVSKVIYLNAGDTIHGGGVFDGASGNRIIYGDNTVAGATVLNFTRID